MADSVNRWQGGGWQLRQLSPSAQFGLALLIFAASVLLRIAVDEVIPERLPFITFFPAVALATLLCGLWPAVLVLLLSAVVGVWWGQPSEGSLVAFRFWAILLFLITGGGVVGLVHYLTILLHRLNRQDEQLALINRELKHRIKNLFSITNSICQQTIKSGAPVEQMAKAASGRILAIASAQDLLSATASEGADLRSLVDALVTPVAPDSSRLEISGISARLPAEFDDAVRADTA